MSKILTRYKDSRLNHFIARFEEDKVFILACHACIPIALTPDLLYKIWLNFQVDAQDNKLKIPLTAVADLLASSICRKIGFELFEIYPEVRAELEIVLDTDSRLKGRKKRIALFLRSYLELSKHRIPSQVFSEALNITSLSILEPNKAAEKVFETLKDQTLSSDEKISKASIQLSWVTIPKPTGQKKSFLKTAREAIQGLHDYNVGRKVDALKVLSKLKNVFKTIASDTESMFKLRVKDQLLKELEIIQMTNGDNRDEEKKVILRETNLFVIGDGGVGKTTLVNRLFLKWGVLPSEDESTKGIETLKYRFVSKDKNEYVVNIIDFGGQEIYHGLVPIFFSPKAIYLFLIDTRREGDSTSIWLHHQSNLGGESPCLFIVNNKEGEELSINEDGLSKEFPNVKQFLNIDFTSDDDINLLEKEVQKEVQELLHIKDEISEKWVKIRDEVIKLNVEKPFLTFKEFVNICSKFEIASDETILILKYFHSLGFWLYFDESSILKEVLFLDRNWLTNQIHQIYNDGFIIGNKGFISIDDFIGNKEFQEPILIFELLKKFNQAFEFESDLLFHQLLPSTKREYSWTSINTPRINYRYSTTLSTGLLFYIMKELFPYLNKEQIWRHGFIIKHDGAIVQITESTETNKIEVRFGEPYMHFREIIEKSIDKFHQEYPDIQIEKFISCNCKECIASDNPNFYNERILKRDQKQGKTIVECPRSSSSVNVNSLLSPSKQLPKELTDFPVNNELTFIERSSELKNIKDNLTENKMLTISGIMGVGKTTLASAYVTSFYEEYEHIVWLNYNAGFSLDSIIENHGLVDSLQINKSNNESSSLFDLFLEKLRNIATPSLLVVDDLDNSIEPNIESLLSLEGWHILFASRRTIRKVPVYRLPPLSVGAANVLFRKYYKSEIDDDFVNELTEAIDFHPLFIEQFATTANEKPFNAERLKQIFKIYKKGDLGIKNNTSEEAKEIAGLFTSIFSFGELSMYEVNLLIQFVCLPDEYHSVLLLSDLIDDEVENLNEALNRLSDMGWLLKTYNDEYKIHKVVRDITTYHVRFKVEDVDKLLDSVLKKLNGTNIFVRAWVPYAEKIDELYKESSHAKILELRERYKKIKEEDSEKFNLTKYGLYRDLNQFKEGANNMIAKGKLREVFDLLNLFLDENSELYNNSLLLESNYNRLKLEERRSAISHENINIQISKISLILIDLFREIKIINIKNYIQEDKLNGKLNEFGTELKKLIRQDKLSYFFKILSEEMLKYQSDYYNDIIHQWARFKRIQKNISNGIMKDNQINFEISSIKRSVLEIVDLFEELDLKIDLEKEEIINELDQKKKGLKLRLVNQSLHNFISSLQEEVLFSKDAFSLLSRSKELRRKLISRTLSDGDSEIEQNKLLSDILNYIDTLERSDFKAYQEELIDLNQIKLDLLNESPQYGISTIIESLKKIIKENAFPYESLIQISNEYQKIKDQTLKGLLPEEEVVQLNKEIQTRLLSLIDEIEKFDSDKNLKSLNGNLLYQIPLTMRLRQEEKCIIRVSFDEKELLKNIHSNDNVVTESNIKLTKNIGVDLVNFEGRSFAVKSFSDSIQFISDDAYTEWVFYVKPLLMGVHTLNLNIKRLEVINGEQVFHERIFQVSVTVIGDEDSEKIKFSSSDENAFGGYKPPNNPLIM